LFQGYGKYSTALRNFLEAQPFANDIIVVEQKDKTRTGNFEVTITETGELIYSKKNGQSKAESDADKKMIAEKIQDILSKR